MNAPEKYSIVRKIADGGMAEIFLARLEGARGFSKQVVLKRIRSAMMSDPQFRNMLIDEAHIAMGLNHGNIAQVLELGESGGSYFLAMELVDGWSLWEVIKRARNADVPLPAELALYVVVEVCRALSYAHNQTVKGLPMGIVHRDVSPQNVLVSEQGDVKLTDFGIAKARTKTEQTGIGVVKGKIMYMSPEQAAGGVIDHRSDLFSLGIVLYQMATGKLPFEGGAPMEVMVRIQAGDFPPPDKAKPRLSKELTQLIMKAMAVRPQDRYQTAEAMLLAAERVLRNEFPPTGRTELKAFLDQLHQRDGVPSISRVASSSEVTKAQQVEIGSLTLTTPEPARPEPRRSGERPRRRAGGQRKLMLAVGGVGLVLVLGVLLAPEPTRSETQPQEEAAAQQIAVAPQNTPSPAPAPLPAPPPPQTEAASASPAEATTADSEDEEHLMAEAVPDAADVVIGEEDGTAEDAEPAPAAPVTPEATAATASPPPPPPPPPPAAASTKTAPVKVASVTPAPRPPASTPTRPKSPAPPPAKADTVSVMVTSQPTGAVVKLNRRVFGKTPIPLRFRTGLVFELTFVKNGFTPTAKRFLVTKRKDQKVVAYLSPVSRKRR